MKILGFDVESTGLDPKKDSITEMGLVLYDTDAKAPVRISGFLVKGGLITAEIERITGITQAMLDTYGYPPEAAVKAFANMAAQADYLCAHNSPFDRSFLVAGGYVTAELDAAAKVIDTRTDLPPEAYKKGKSASLKYLCADHGFLYSAHRAVNDVLAMLELLSRYDLDVVLKRATTPNAEVRAVVSFDNRTLAKERGYYWKAELKQWRKPMKADEVQAEKNTAPFPVVLVVEEKCQ